METIVAWVMAHEWAIYVTSVITIASAVMALLPSTIKGEKWYNMVMKGLNFLAFNIGKNKSKDDKTVLKVDDGTK